MDKSGASAKHLDFHLQREKALTKDLEGKCKSLQAQIAQLEQDKAELRREKLALSDELKRSSKLDERVHFLQKELEYKDELLDAEKSKVMDAIGETERIRNKANASIAAWTDAERQWIAEQESLNADIAELRERLEQVNSAHTALRETCEDTAHALQKKEQLCEKLEISTSRLEADVASLHGQLEKSQNKVFDLEQAIYRLDLAGVKQKEVLSLKDTEINALEAKIAQHVQNEEKLEQAITSLSDRVNAAKMMDLQGKGEKEKLFCDVVDAQKETQRLRLQIEAFKRDIDLGTQTQSRLQDVVDELRTKCTEQLEEIKARSVQIRKDELVISQQQMDLNKLQSQKDEWEFRFSSLQGELREAQEQINRLASQLDDEKATNHKLQSEIQSLQSQIDVKEEAIVVAGADAEEKMETLRQDVRSLDREVQVRQQMIKELTSQLAEANEKNSSYHSKILEEADASARVRQLINNLQTDVFRANQELLFYQCAEEKGALFMAQSHTHACMASSMVWHWQKQHARFCDDMRVTEQNLVTMEATLLETQNQLAARCAALALAEERIAELTTLITEKDSLLQSQGVASAALSAELTHATERVEELRVLLRDAETDQDLLRAHINGLESDAKEIVACSSQRDATMTRFATWTTEAEDAMALTLLTKNALLAGACAEMSRLATESAEHAVSQKESLERRCRELEAFIKETKATLVHKDVALAEKETAQDEKVAALQRAMAAAEKEKNQISFQLGSLLTRFEEEHAAFESLKQKLAKDTAVAASMQEAMQAEIMKLRKGIEYELKRKCEYKDALEKLRLLRDESESLRAREKSLSEGAIAEANNEASYWIDAFDRLKRLIESTKRGEQSMPTIDSETASRLENAKSKIFGPIRSQDVNTGRASPLVKRRRVDSE